MIEALERIADGLAFKNLAEEPKKKPISRGLLELDVNPGNGWLLQKRLCPSCNEIVFHELEGGYAHCTVCGRISRR